MHLRGGFMDNLHPLYLQEGVQKQVREQLFSQGFVQLSSLFSVSELRKLNKIMRTSGKIKRYNPDKFSFTKILFSEEEKKLLFDKIGDLLTWIAGKKVKILELEGREFKHRDYTLLHDEESLKNYAKKVGKRHFFCLELSSDWLEESGGQDYFVFDEETFILPVLENSFSVVLEVEKHFTKYVNCLADGRKRVLIMGFFH